MGSLKELLAKPDSIRITAPVLSRQTLEHVLETIRRDNAIAAATTASARAASSGGPTRRSS